MKEPALHIVFGAYGAKTLRKDIHVMSRPDEVVSFDDDLSYGPIEPLDPLARWAWVRREFRPPPQDRARFVKTAAFWEAPPPPPPPPPPHLTPPHLPHTP